MNRVIIMSIRPEWLVKILNGEKTIEIRKTMPKCDLPIDVYLYCTKNRGSLHRNKHTIKRFVCHYKKPAESNVRNGLVVAKFTLNKIEDCCDMGLLELEGKSLLTISEICSYIKAKEVDPKMVYAWHIDNLEIFDKPKELSEFYRVIHYPKGQFITPDICEYGEGYEEDKKQCLKSFKVNKAPQSWQYAWLLE